METEPLECETGSGSSTRNFSSSSLFVLYSFVFVPISPLTLGTVEMLWFVASYSIAASFLRLSCSGWSVIISFDASFFFKKEVAFRRETATGSLVALRWEHQGAQHGTRQVRPVAETYGWPTGLYGRQNRDKRLRYLPCLGFSSLCNGLEVRTLFCPCPCLWSKHSRSFPVTAYASGDDETPTETA